MAYAIADQARPAGWLRGPAFDLGFVVGIAAAGAAAGAAALLAPALLWPIVFADLWLLGYHHVIATYTRLAFDRQSFAEHRLLMLGLPLLVLGAVMAAGYGIGLWTLTTVYFYWQWFHYARQSWGVSQVYRRKAGGLAGDGDWLAQAVFYLPPLWGVLHRSAQAPATFLGLEFVPLPVPALVADAVGILAVAAMAMWVGQRALACARDRLPFAHTLYMLSHFAIFLTGYILIADVTTGWLVVNVWHNAQYIAFVWLYNNSRYKTGIDPAARFLSTISQTRNVALYLLVCVGLSTAIYLTIDNTITALVAPVIVWQTINFHHYIVDGLIWKVRRKPLQQTLGIAPPA